MPFDAEFNPIYEQLIKPSLVEAGYEITRADNLLDQQNILRDIVVGIATADLVIADLTTQNANVFYELGLCHGLRVSTVLITQSMEDVPFDLRSYRVQVYETRFDKIHELKKTLKEIGERHKSRSVTFGSPVVDFLPAGSAVADRPSTDESEHPAEEEAEEAEDKGGADFAADMEEALEAMSETVYKVGEEIIEMGGSIATRTARLQLINENPMPGAARKKRQILMAAAADMNRLSKFLETEIPNFERNVDALHENFSGFATFLQSPTKEDKEKLISSRQMLTTFSEQVKTGLVSLRSFSNTVSELKGLSKEVNRASRRLAQAMDEFILNAEKVEAFSVRMLALTDDFLADVESQ